MKHPMKQFTKFAIVSCFVIYVVTKYFMADMLLNIIAPKTQILHGCMCERKLFYDTFHTNRFKQQRKNLSSCSDEGTFYQDNQKILSYTLYQGVGDEDPRDYYVQCLRHNIQMMRKFYPGYSMRLYTNLQLDPEFCSILCSNSDVFWCDINKTPSDRNASDMVFRTWRFLALGDPTVQIMLSRDLDSTSSAREAAVVKDWLDKGDKPISLMRDHYQHGWHMQAGMWQANNSKFVNGTAEQLRTRIIQLSKDPNTKKDKYSDQKILKKVIYDNIPRQIVAYDSFFCAKLKQTEVRPFVTERVDPKTDFVGNVLNCTSVGCTLKRIGSGACPVDCRPIYGKNWTYC